MTKKIRVLECIRQGKIGGGESHLLNLVENLDRSQFEPSVLSFTDGPMIQRLQQMGVKTSVIHTERPFDISKWKKVRKLMVEDHIELVHAHGTRAGSNVLWAARSLNIPVVYTIHGWSFHPDQNGVLRRLRILGEQYITSKTDVNISVSSANQNSGRINIPGFQSRIVNYGIDQKKFSPANAFNDIRRELGIPDNKILILFIARFTVQKQPLAMLKAFHQALQQRKDLHLLMVGDGDQAGQVRELAKSLDLDNNITFQSFRQDVPDVLASADIFVLPSLWEGLPIGLLEAMAMGKAIIASDVDGTGEVLRQHENGILIQTNELVAELAKALILLSGDKDLRNSFQQKALETITEKFNVSTMTKTIENIYQEVLTNNNSNHGI